MYFVGPYRPPGETYMAATSLEIAYRIAAQRVLPPDAALGVGDAQVVSPFAATNNHIVVICICLL